MPANAPPHRYAARQQPATPRGWVLYDEHYDQPIRRDALSKREAETIAGRLNESGVDWIHDADERSSASRYWPVDHNDGHYPDDSEVWLWYPRPTDDEHDRHTWHWLTGYILGQCGPDEWHVAVDDDRVIEDEAQDWIPACFRDSSEIRPRLGDEDPADWPPEPHPGAGTLIGELRRGKSGGAP